MDFDILNNFLKNITIGGNTNISELNKISILKNKGININNINDYTLDLTLTYNIPISPDMLNINFRELVYKYITENYIQKAYGVFYIIEIYDLTKDRTFPLINVTEPNSSEMILNLLTKIFYITINQEIEFTIYKKNNNIIGENKYITCNINKNQYQSIISNNLIKINNSKSIEIGSKQIIKITDIKNSTKLNTILCTGEFVFK